jgi:hypothetical protein
MKTVVLRFLTDGADHLVRLEPADEQALAEKLSADFSVTPKVELDDGTSVDLAYAAAAYEDPASHPDRFTAIGEYLFKLAFPGPLQAKWSALRAAGPIRLILDVGIDALRALPWELMNEGSGNSPPVFQDVENPACLGSIDPAQAPGAVEVEWPLRVLVIVACSPNEQKGMQPEVDAVKDALVGLKQFVDFRIRYRATAKEIAEELRTFQPHILHFIGHGALDGNASLALFRGEAGPYDHWPAQEIRSSLGAIYAKSNLPGRPTLPPLRLALISACRSSLAFDVRSKLHDVGKAFLGAKCRAVIGMRGDILGVVATEITKHLYREIAEGRSVDAALAYARVKAAELDDLGAHASDWSMPCLTVTVPPDRVLGQAAHETWQKITAAAELQEFYFSDHHEVRHSLTERFDPAIVTNQPNNLTILTGARDTGKSWLLLWCLYRAVLRGRQVLLVDLADQSRDYVGIVDKMLREPKDASSSLIRGPLRPDLFEPMLKQLASWVTGTPIAQLPNPIPPLSLPSARDNLPDLLFPELRQVLEQIAKDAPLILAFDHLRKGNNTNVTPALFKYIVDHLITPIRNGNVKNVRAVIAIRSEDVQDYELEAFVPKHGLKLEGLSREDWEETVIEYMQHRNEKDARGDYAEIARSMLKKIKNPWLPVQLEQFARLFNNN